MEYGFSMGLVIYAYKYLKIILYPLPSLPWIFFENSTACTWAGPGTWFSILWDLIEPVEIVSYASYLKFQNTRL